MGLGTDHVILSEVPNFVPTLWSDEVIASYKANLVMGNLVRKLNHRGKKGASIKIPTPTRGSASSKAAAAARETPAALKASSRWRIRSSRETGGECLPGWQSGPSDRALTCGGWLPKPLYCGRKKRWSASTPGCATTSSRWTKRSAQCCRSPANRNKGRQIIDTKNR